MMLTGPVDVTKKLFERSGMKKSDIDLFELNEALPRWCGAHPGLRHRHRQDEDLNGGAIALRPSARRHRRDDPRHRARRARRTNKSTALAPLCIGGGLGTETIIERV